MNTYVITNLIVLKVGARGSDVFKIYFSEAGIICLICFALSAVLGGVGCYILNNEMSEGLAIQLFDYGPINLGIYIHRIRFPRI